VSLAEQEGIEVCPEEDGEDLLDGRYDDLTETTAKTKKIRTLTRETNFKVFLLESIMCCNKS